MEDLKDLHNYIMNSKDIDALYYTNNQVSLKDLWQSNIQDSEISLFVKKEKSKNTNGTNLVKYILSQAYYNKYFYDLELYQKIEKEINSLSHNDKK